MKDEQIRQFLDKWDVDVYGMTEPNVNWSKVRKKDNFWERSESWFEARKLAVGYNINRGRLATKAQYGGTITMSRNDISHRGIKSGYDTSGLGRWSWLAFRGKKKSITRVITAYCAVNNATGPNTVYSQQLKHLNKDPITSFWEDLATDIRKWQLQGDQIVLMGDWNQETHSEQFIAWYSSLGLVDPILDKHGTDAPPTYNKGTRHIDGILVSATLQSSRCGYLPFDSLPGDHRVLYIDIKVKSFIGHRASNIPSHAARRLKLEDPRVVARYQMELESILISNKSFVKAKQLQEYVRSTGTFDRKAARDFEHLDSIREAAMHKAEKKCRKLKMGGKQWSPALQRGRDKILLWTLVLRRLLGRNISAKRIIRLKKKLKIIDTLVTQDIAKANINQAYKEYKTLRKKDVQLSRTYRDDLAQAKAEAGNSSVAGIIRGLAAKESQRKASRRIKHTLGKYSNSGTCKIEVSNPDGTTKEVTDPDEMNDHIADENRSKFHQTENCPLLEENILKDLGLLGDGPEIINVLNGTYIPPEGTSWATRRWLQQMKISNPMARNEIVTSLKDYRDGWKKSNERTASGELHMGHFKASAAHDRLGWFNFLMALLPYSCGYVPSRWQQGTDVMLLKKEELFLLSKLRTIVLYEADYNHENKRLGRAAMKLAISKGKIAKEQFSRPSRSAQENVICKRLVFDYCRGKKKPIGMCACDLKSCYDRIVHVAASLALQRIGVPLGKIKSMFGTVQLLVHKIRTMYGDSACSYGGKDDVVQHDLPPQGVGQGNGAGPTIWSVLSSTVFEILHAEGLSTTFVHSISQKVYKLCGFSYVDDCDLFHLGEDVTDVHSNLQTMLTMWDELMEVNGGAIAPDKCWWYLADFKWSKGRWKMMDASKDKQLIVRDKDRRFHSLQNLPISEAKEMLGVFLAPDGNEKQALQSLTNKVTTWTNFITNGGLDWFTTWQALQTTIIKSLSYSLPALTLTKKEIEDISKPLHAIALPRCGYSRSFPKKVLYGPREFQGLGLENLYLAQYVPKISAIIDYTYKGSTSGNNICSNLEVTKLEAGIPGPLFAYKYRLAFLTGQKSWIAETKDFCWEHNIYFEERSQHLLPKRTNDEFIMDVFIRYGNYSIAEMQSINRCRLFLHVTTASDIATGDGYRILDDIFIGKIVHRKDNFDWPNQSRPPKAAWDFWSKQLRRHFAPERAQLSSPLGEWIITEDDDYYSSWEWWVNDKEEVYQHINDNWYLIAQHSDLLRQTRLHSNTYPASPEHRTLLQHRPPDISRTSISPIVNGVFTTTGSRPRHLPLTPPSFPEIHFIDHLRQQIDAWLFQACNLYINLDSFVSLLHNGKLIAVSDGSFNPKYRTGSTAWCFATSSGSILLEGGGMIPGTTGHQGAYRSEAGGLLGIATVLSTLDSIFPPPSEYKITIACDGESALYQCLQMPKEKISSSLKHYDIISRVQDKLSQSSCKPVPIHVRGHQDDKSKSPLSILEKLNVRMDALAKRIMVMAKEANLKSLPHLPYSPDGLPIVSLHGSPLPSELGIHIKEGINTLAIKEWWASKGRFKVEDDRYIDWEVMVYCMNNCGSRYKRFIPKWTSGQIAVGKVMRYRKARIHNRCPRCNAFTEDTTHVLRCPSRKATIKWELMVDQLSCWLTKVNTSPEINIALCALLKHWRKPRTPDQYMNPEWGPNIRKVFRHQASLGWKNFLEGILSTGWADLQQIHYDSISSQKKGTKWAGSLSIKLWTMVFGMWEHRNNALFESDKISEYQGSRELKEACIVELELGIGQLDELYHPYLDTVANELFKEKLDYQRNWFSIVRQAREKKLHVYTDIFSKCNNTRAWVGLEPLQCSV